MPQTVLWRRVDFPGHEISTLEELQHGWKLSGTALFSYKQGPTRLDYTVICDSFWQTESARVGGVIGKRQVDLTILVDAGRRWFMNGVPYGTVEGCVDIDLGFSPSTNLLPIRRIALAVGEEAVVRAAWLPFPPLDFEPLSQVYRRERETTYRYVSGDGAFVTMLETNPDGLVTSYPGLWHIESQTS